jgi:hypothetical protein
MFGSEQLVAKIILKWQNNVTLKMVQPKFSPGLGEIDGKIISTWNLGISRGEMPERVAERLRVSAASVVATWLTGRI